MPEVFQSEGPADAALAAAESVLAEGGLVVIPTDTVYGVASRPDVRGATDRIFEAKGRPRDLTLPVLVAGTADAGQIAEMDDRALALAHEFWPGGLTLILPRTDESARWDLGAEKETIGVRVPAHGLAIALLSVTGPLAATSANRSGEETPPTCDGVQEALGDSVSVYLCGGPALGQTPSTILDLTSDEPRVLRSGLISPEDILGGPLAEA